MTRRFRGIHAKNEDGTESTILTERIKRKRTGLKVEHDPLGWWVMDYAQRRGDKIIGPPTVVAGPFEKEKAAKDLRDHLAYHEGEK